MIRAFTGLIALAVKALAVLALGLFLLGILPGPLLWWLAGEGLRLTWAFFSLPAPVVGIATGAVVGVGLGKWLHNAPLKAQKASAIEKAHQAYEAQKW